MRPGNTHRQMRLARLDALLERVVVDTPHGRNASGWALLVGGLLAGATLVRWTVPVIDLFAFPVLVATFVFRYRGLVSIPFALLLYHLASRPTVPPRALLVSDGVQLLEWSLLAIFILVTLDKYTAVRRLQTTIYQDLELARTVQTALTAPEYDFGRVRIDGSIHQSSDVGGDFYYFRPFQQKYVVFCLGDVMGKGISASLLMALVMGFMFEWGKKSPSPRFILRKLNHRLTRLWGKESHWFITMFYAVYNEESGRLTYAGAGHQAGVVLPRTGTPFTIRAEGLPVGILEEVDFEEVELPLGPGDRVLLFTDGITEARSPRGDLFGVDRLLEILDRHRGLSGRSLIEVVEEEVLLHAGGRLTDDMALLVVEVKS